MVENTEKEVTAVQEEQTDLWKLTHVGFGKYRVGDNDKVFKSKAEAVAWVEQQKKLQEFDSEFGDVVPDDFDFSVTDRVYEYRGSLMELAMNELFAPDGSHNPYYDREYYWGWAAFNGTSIADKRTKGYKTVSYDELEKGVKADRYPEHLLSMVREDGSLCVYGDSVLMRMPRVLWRQRRAEKQQAALRRIQKVDQQQRDFFDKSGVGIERSPVKNELEIRF
jgi:hypothetical protein